MKIKNIDNGSKFDFGRTSNDYAKYRDIYPEAFYEKIVNLGLCTKEQRVLDLGTGTGVIPRNLYKYGAKFTGLDISEEQLKEAKRLSDDMEMDIEYVVGSAEDIDFPNESFDTVIASQCHIYFDKKAAFPNIHRVLKKDGNYLITWMAWLPEESEIAKYSEELVLKYNPSWTGSGSKRSLISEPNWVMELFRCENSECFDLNVHFTRDSWHGRMKTCRGIGASTLSVDEIARWEEEHIEYLKTQPESFDILHFVSILNLKKI